MIYIVTFQNPFEDTNGVACHIVDLRNGLLKMGEVVEVVCPFDNFLGRNLFHRIALRIVSRIAYRGPSEFWLVVLLYLQSKIIRQKLEKVPDGGVVNCEDIISLYALSKVRKAGLKKIFTIHFAIAPWEEFLAAGYFKENSRIYRVFRDQLRASLAIEGLNVVAVSQSSIELYRKTNPRHQVQGQNLYVVPPGIDVDTTGLVGPAIYLPTAPYIVNVGSVMEVKNQYRLAELALELKRQGLAVKIVCVGDFDQAYREKLVEYLKDSGIENQFMFTGPVSRDVVFGYVTRARLMVHTSQRESFGMSVVEAMGLGCPVVAYHYTALDEIMPETPDAMLDPNAELATNATQIRLFWENEAELQSLKVRQRGAFRSRFAFEKMVESFQKIYYG